MRAPCQRGLAFRLPASAAALAVIILVSYGIYTARSQDFRPGVSYMLRPSEEEAAILAAARGDGKAALRLYKHFEFYADDHDLAIRWLRVGAKSGDLKAASMLGSLLVSDGDVVEGMHWIRSAAARGDEIAKAYLRELDVAPPGKGSEDANR